MKYYLVLLLSTLSYCLQAQEFIKGCLIDEKSEQALFGAFVYYNGESVGVSTKLDGCFALKLIPESTTAIIISSLGYELKVLENRGEAIDLGTIKLTPKVDNLETVSLVTDDWSRQKKEAIFLRNFLGTILYADDCVVKNLAQIELRFNRNTNLLTAVSNEPIIIINNALGYELRYDLIEFEVKFESIIPDKNIQISQASKQTLDLLLKPRYKELESFFAGTVFFKELGKKGIPSKKHLKARKTIYEISPLLFYRAMSQNVLNENKFFLNKDKAILNSSDHIRVSLADNIYKVVFRENSYNVADRNGQQTIVEIREQPIYIDEFGNLLTPQNILLGGSMSYMQVSGMLPLSYGMDKPLEGLKK